jgi:Zn-dependent M28 family amino/carboxypeptidase
LWVEYKHDTKFQDFFDYNDLGLPLAYAISTQIVSSSTLAENFINETFDLFLEVLDIEEDTGFDTLEDIFVAAGG